MTGRECIRVLSECQQISDSIRYRSKPGATDIIRSPRGSCVAPLPWGSPVNGATDGARPWQQSGKLSVVFQRDCGRSDYDVEFPLQSPPTATRRVTASPNHRTSLGDRADDLPSLPQLHHRNARCRAAFSRFRSRHQGMTRQILADGSPQRAGALSVYDLQRRHAFQRGIVQQ